MRPDDVVERRFVEIGPESGNNTVIERGLSAGEMIVVEGTHKLAHGMKVIAVMAEDGQEEPAGNEESND